MIGRQPALTFERLVFENKVNNALRSVEKVLDIERHPRLAGDVEHSYQSKYDLVDTTSNAALIACMNVFDIMGLNSDILQSLDKKHATTLSFEASISCTLDKEVIVDVPKEMYFEETKSTKSSGIFGNSESKRVSTVVQHITEFHYKVDIQWLISVYSGKSIENKQVINSRSCLANIITQNKNTALPDHKVFRPLDLSLTWLLAQIDAKSLSSHFKIDVEDNETKTPIRNKSVEKALDFSNKLSAWSSSVAWILTHDIAEYLLTKHNPASSKQLDFSLDRLNEIHKQHFIFNPILPVMKETETSSGANTETCDSTNDTSDQTNNNGDDVKVSLSTKDISKLLLEHVRTMGVAIDDIKKSSPGQEKKSVVSSSEFGLVLLLRHLETDLCQNLHDSMAYVESLMETQLVLAIGKMLNNDDLEAFVRYHNARFLSPAPKPFALAISRPNHYPVGLLSIERADSSDDCIYTHSRVVNTGSAFSIPLNAATTLELQGNQMLHGWLQHRFGPSRVGHNLVARARQFSSFILIIGTMTEPTRLEPKDAIIVQNKDEVLIPLLVSELPTAKEFKDAVRSLSPKQKQFAHAVRSMQLASSVFGVCIVQIKPQLESLLGLPPDALDKEMKLAQDLMELFVEYQVPSDLLSYNSLVGNVAVQDKISNVKENVKGVMDVINLEKEKQLKVAQLKTDMAIEEKIQTLRDDMAHSSSPPPAPYSGDINARRRLKKSAAPPAAMAMTSSPPVSMEKMAMPEAIPSAIGTKNTLLGSDPSYHCAETTESNLAVPRRKSVVTEGSDDVLCQQSRMNQSHSVDFTLMPKILDAAVEKSEADASLRSTLLKTSDNWSRNRQENILAKCRMQKLNSSDIRKEKSKAFDLLDALSRSGSLPIKHCDLHVMVSVTHCFEKDVIDTVIQDNIDPIEKIELSTILFASTIYGNPRRELIKDQETLQRLEGSEPLLLQQGEE